MGVQEKNWFIQVLIAGSTGLLGSIISAVSEMGSLNVSNFFDLKVGTYFILLSWLVGMGIVAPGIWLFGKAKVDSAEIKTAKT